MEFAPLVFSALTPLVDVVIVALVSKSIRKPLAPGVVLLEWEDGEDE
jgi:hypothetical protein